MSSDETAIHQLYFVFLLLQHGETTGLNPSWRFLLVVRAASLHSPLAVAAT